MKCPRVVIAVYPPVIGFQASRATVTELTDTLKSEIVVATNSQPAVQRARQINSRLHRP
jgi:hypothetical protein